MTRPPARFQCQLQGPFQSLFLSLPLLLVSCLALVPAGCSSVRIIPFEQRAGLRDQRPGPTLAQGLGVVCTSVPQGQGQDQEAQEFRPRVRADELADELAEAVRAHGRLTQVHLLSPYPGAGEGPLDASFRQARAAGLDLLLVLRCTQWSVAYEGVGPMFIPALLISGTIWFPQPFIADELYRATVSLEADLYSVHTETLLEEVEFGSDRVYSLNEIDKGWTVAGTLINWPGRLSASNWQRIADGLLPMAWDDVREDVVTYMRKQLPLVLAEPAVQEATRKVLVLAVGVDAYADPVLGRSPYAEADAGAFAAMLREHEGCLPGNVVELKGGGATRQALFETADALRRRLRRGDEAVIYYAGKGCMAGGRPSVLPADASRADLAGTSVPLAALVARVLGQTEARATLVLDCSFSGVSRRSVDGQGPASGGGQGLASGGGQGLASGGGQGPASGGGQGPASGGSLAGGSAPPGLPEDPRLTMLLACSSGEPARDLPDRGQGLFTGALLEALGRDGDADGDGAVSLDELTLYLKRQVQDRTLFDSPEQRQSPRVLKGASASQGHWLARTSHQDSRGKF